jgi:hypothetical protein
MDAKIKLQVASFLSPLCPEVTVTTLRLDIGAEDCDKKEISPMPRRERNDGLG